MPRLSRNKKIQLLEAVFWLLLIIATVFVVTRLKWSDAAQILQYMSVLALLVSVYLYLTNRSLYHQGRIKTEQLIEKQRELKDRQKTIDLIYQNSADGILVLNQDKRIEEFSPGLEKITGYKRADALGRNAQELLKFSAQKDFSLLPDMMFTIAGANRKTQYIENSLITKPGKIVEIEASHTLIHDKNSPETMALAIIRDVTYEKSLIERDKEFITVTSHQLNTPLSIIRGYASLMASGKIGKLTSKQSEYASQILESTEKMIDLVQSMLSISRIEQEKIQLDITDVNIADLISSSLEMFEQKAAAKNIRLIEKPIPNNILVMADPEKLKQVLSNLIDNAIKYTAKGRITVSVVDRPEVIDIIVADTGIGIPAREIEKIGTRFYRSQNAIDVDNHGTGLGVYIANTIIEKHHGHMKIESTEGSYTKFTITLPKKQKTALRP